MVMTTDWPALTKQLRQARGLKQAALAEFLGTTQATVSRWEHGLQVPEERFRRRIRAELSALDPATDDMLIASMIAQSPCMMSVVDESLRFVSYSTGLSQALGAKVKRLRHDRLSDIITPISRGIFLSYVHRMFRTDCDIVSVSVNDRAALQEGVYLRRCWSAIRLSGRRLVVCQDQPITTERARLLELNVVTIDQLVPVF